MNPILRLICLTVNCLLSYLYLPFFSSILVQRPPLDLTRVPTRERVVRLSTKLLDVVYSR